jgi:hypothetical protein
MGNAIVKSKAQNFPAVFQHVNVAEIVPKAQRNRRKF